MTSVQTKNSDTDMKHQNYFWLLDTVEFVAQSTTYACGKHFNVLNRFQTQSKLLGGPPEFHPKMS